MPNEDVRRELFRLRDEAYRAFMIRLIPTVDPDTVIGVRTPPLRLLAARLAAGREAPGILGELPHSYFEENQLHAFILSGMKDYGRCLEELDRFLPFVDNWATCDQMSPRVFRKHRKELVPCIERWLASGRTYTVRFAVKMLMEHYLDGDFDPKYPEAVAGIRPGEYYVDMMAAWYFATALAKQYDAAVPFIEGRRLPAWTHMKAIQKAVESRRVPPERKEYLKSLRIRGDRG
ncbi:MAG: DNA alkylation repair protein [Clostridia bacterium]|nr:DNA alkylation repair protein [Clostridia bacterium]